MKLWKYVLFAASCHLSRSCSIQKQQPQIQLTHVLAVTHEGDTLKLPIDVIRPINFRIINYNNSSWSRPYYYSPPYYNYNNYSYSGSSRSSNNSTNTNKKNNSTTY
jgi:hypothetical protein